MVSELSKKVRTLPELRRKIEQLGISTYERNEIFTGIWNAKKTRKYRLKTLGIDTEQLERMITQEKERLRQLRQQRNNERNRER